jgi:hypothetical protein
MEVKQVSTQLAVKELNEPLGGKDKFLVECYNKEDVCYVPVTAEEAVSSIGKEIVYLSTEYRMKEIKFRPCRKGSGQVQVEIY